MVAKLNGFSAQLGYGGAEIFPKQVSRANEQDRGNWINLAYHGGDKSERYAIHEGQKLNFKEFLNLAEKKRVKQEQLNEFEPELKTLLKKEKLTTRDSRSVERKKYGYRKARRSFQFSKR